MDKKDDFSEDEFWKIVAAIYAAILMTVYFLWGETAFYIGCGLLVFAVFAVWFLFIHGKKKDEES